jgi:hypothetical protein
MGSNIWNPISVSAAQQLNGGVSPDGTNPARPGLILRPSIASALKSRDLHRATIFPCGIIVSWTNSIGIARGFMISISSLSLPSRLSMSAKHFENFASSQMGALTV